LGAALAMLARAVGALVHGAFGAAPDTFAHAAVELVLGVGAFGHRKSENWRKSACPAGRSSRKGADYTHALCAVKRRFMAYAARRTSREHFLLAGENEACTLWRSGRPNFAGKGGRAVE